MRSGSGVFSRSVLDLDCVAEAARIERHLSELVLRAARRRGVVLGISGGIDSSVTAALCVRALGPERVVGLMTPERESSADSERLAMVLATHLGIETAREDITGILDAAGCYRRRDEAVRSVVRDYGPGHTSKIVLPPLSPQSPYRIFSVVVNAPDGTQLRKRLTYRAYTEIVAASNFKQRVRKMMEYYHAERRSFVVAGTPNRLEYDQGFFVKLGDGAADVKPIAHLYKTHVYQLAAYLNIPDEIRERPPTTDTYSLSQSQEEFFFSVPYETLDLCMFGKDNGISAADISTAVGLSEPQVHSVLDDIDSKRVAAGYLHMPPNVLREADGAGLALPLLRRE